MRTQSLTGARDGVRAQHVAALARICASVGTYCTAECSRKKFTCAAAHPIERRITGEVLKADERIVGWWPGFLPAATGGKCRQKKAGYERPAAPSVRRGDGISGERKPG